MSEGTETVYERGAANAPVLNVQPNLVVTGFLGSGKSWLARRLTGADAAPVAGPFDAVFAGVADWHDGSEWRVLEGSPFSVPDRAPGRALVATIDAVNGADLLTDVELRPLVAGQLRAADIVVLTCGEASDPAATLRAVRAETAAPVLLAHEEGGLRDAVLRALDPAAVEAQAGDDYADRFTTWSYAGSAVLTKEAMTAFLTNRPAGAYRIAGSVMLTEGGGRVDIFGRGRLTSVVDRPDQTRLMAAGLASRLERREMDLAWAEAVSAAAYGRGVIACR